MNNDIFYEKGKRAIINYYLEQEGYVLDVDRHPIYTVWFSKTLDHRKALMSSSIADGRYFEFTWNGIKEEGYLDVYKKQKNIVVKNIVFR